METSGVAVGSTGFWIVFNIVVFLIIFIAIVVENNKKN